MPPVPVIPALFWIAYGPKRSVLIPVVRANGLTFGALFPGKTEPTTLAYSDAGKEYDFVQEPPVKKPTDHAGRGTI